MNIEHQTTNTTHIMTRCCEIIVRMRKTIWHEVNMSWSGCTRDCL